MEKTGTSNLRNDAIKSCIEASIDNADPEWKGAYLDLVKILLTKQRYVEGGEFKKFCVRRGLWAPDTHNRWVGMPTLLQRLGWIEPIGKLEPTTVHSHIGSLTFWRSCLFDEEKVLHHGIPRSAHPYQSQRKDGADSSQHDRI